MMKKSDKLQILFALTIAYFFIAIVEIIAEFNIDFSLIFSTKPLLMPVLIAIYYIASRKKNILFITALIFNCAANILFIFQDSGTLFLGNIILVFSKLFVLFVVLKLINLKNVMPILLGILPFLSLYIFIINMTIDELGDGIYLFILQSLLVTIYGGVALGSYMLRPNKANTFLLISSILFAFSQFTFVLRLFYLDTTIFQPIAMLLFVIGMYLLTRFILIMEKKY